MHSHNCQKVRTNPECESYIKEDKKQRWRLLPLELERQLFLMGNMLSLMTHKVEKHGHKNFAESCIRMMCFAVLADAKNEMGTVCVHHWICVYFFFHSNQLNIKVLHMQQLHLTSVRQTEKTLHCFSIIIVFWSAKAPVNMLFEHETKCSERCWKHPN